MDQPADKCCTVKTPIPALKHVHFEVEASFNNVLTNNN